MFHQTVGIKHDTIGLVYDLQISLWPKFEIQAGTFLNILLYT